MRQPSRLVALGVLALSACTLEPSAPEGVTPPAPEGVTTQAQAVKKGSVIVTEIFASPPGSGDGREWFEVQNTTTDSIDLKGWTFQDDKTKTKIDKSVVVAAGAYAVLGQSDKTSENGGVTVAFAYGKSVGLGGSGDEIHLLDPDDKEIDAVVYKDKNPWPKPVDGVALQLDPAHLDAGDNDDGASWCLASVSFAADGSLGTPGKANPACGEGTAGAGGSGAGGASTAGTGGSGVSGTSGQSGKGGTAGSGGTTGTAGTASGGASGASCQVRFSKVDVNQPDAAGAPKDTAEAVELQVTGSFVAGATTLADCGVASLSPFDADADATGACGPKAATYAAVTIGSLTVPASGFVVIGNIAEADLPLTSSSGGTSAVLKNGPDYLTLRGSDGGIVAAVAYADNDAPAVLPSCEVITGAEDIPADANSKDDPAHDLIDVRCADGWRVVDAAVVTWKAPNPCEAGGAGSGGSGQAGGASGGTSAAAGVAGKASGGASAAGASGHGGAGASAAGSAGKVTGEPGGSEAAGPGGSGAAGTTSASAGSAAQDGDCSCRAAGAARAEGAGAWLAVLGAVLAGRCRRGRRG